MNRRSTTDQEFIEKLRAVIEANLKDEQFGVSKLAREVGMSRSNLYEKVKSITHKSVSSFIREVRLKKAMELLQQTSLTVSEVAYEVGFVNPSYFNKCFHDYYGFTPGEVGNKDHEEESVPVSTKKKPHNRLIWISASISLVVIISVIATSKHLIFKAKVPVEKSIIVLPFNNLSSEQSLPFAEGISNDIREQLTKISGLRVLPRTTAEQYRETRLSAPEIAKQTGVNYILDGSVLRQNNKVRINIELIGGLQDDVLWSEKYDRQLADIFVIQTDIAKNVADRLQSILTPDEIKQIQKSHPQNADAYDKYLMGQYFCLKRDSASMQKGVRYFEEAIGIDSSYARAYAGLADAYYALSLTGNIEQSTGYGKANKMAEKALEMDSTLSEAYAVMGIVNFYGYWEWEKARKLFEKALEVDSNFMVTHLYYSCFLAIVGEPENALAQVNRAIELEPYLPLSYIMKGIYCRFAKKYAESTDAYRRAFELNPGRQLAPNGNIFYNFLHLGDGKAAAQTLKERFSVDPQFHKYENEVTDIYETSGVNGLLRFCLEVTLKENKQSSRLYAMLGMKEEALELLEKSCKKGGAFPLNIRAPEFESLYSEPRFQALLDTMNLTPYYPIPSK